MATTPVTVYGYFAGMTSPTLMIYPLGSGAVANGSGDALTANAAGATAWDTEVTEALEGVYRFEVVASGVVVAFGFLPMADTTTRVHGVHTEAEAYLRLAQEEMAADIAEINNKIITTNVTVISHQTPEGGIVLYKGDAYSTANGLPIQFVNPTGEGWPADITGTINFAAVHEDYEDAYTAADSDLDVVPDTHKIIGAGTVTTATAPNQKVTIELTSEQTDKAIGVYNYDCEVVISGEPKTLVSSVQPGAFEPQFTSAPQYENKLQLMQHYARTIT